MYVRKSQHVTLLHKAVVQTGNTFSSFRSNCSHMFRQLICKLLMFFFELKVLQFVIKTLGNSHLRIPHVEIVVVLGACFTANITHFYYKFTNYLVNRW